MDKNLNLNLKKTRLEKLEKFKKAKIDPYPSVAKRSHTCAEIIKNFKKLEEKTVFVVGRIFSIRSHGRSTFVDIRDGSGKIQIYLRENVLGKEKYKFFDNFDIGDFIQAEGRVFKTKRGEITVEVKDYKILAKSLLPLPEKWHGLKDRELRYRKRYLDLIMNPKVKEIFLTRSQIIETIREFLLKKGFVEVETPILQPIYGGGLARPFKTHHNVLDIDMYLRISTELYLKRLIVGGFENVFEIARLFRNEGVDLWHNPEFTILETMSAYYNYEDNIKLTEELFRDLIKKILGRSKITYQGQKIDLKPPWKKITLNEAVKKYTSFDMLKIKNLKEAQEKAKDLNIDIKGLDSIGLIAERIFEKKVEEKLIQPTIVYKYPVEGSPLAKKCSDDPRFTERFEVFIAGQEFSNNYSELNDPLDLKKRFIEEKKKLKAGFPEAHQTDEDFLEAIEYGMPPTSGLGISIDRLVMLFTDQPCIRDVILFPTMRPK